jgi:hypothetical protein
MMFYFGYYTGGEGIEVIDGDAVPAQLEAVRDHCNEHPDATIIEAFDEVMDD